MSTGMERLVAAMTGGAADRIPVFCNLLDQGAQELGLTLKEYYSRGEHVAEGQLRMRERYGYDNLWSLFYVGKEAELLGCRKIIFAKDGPPNVGEMIIKTYDDIARLQIPDDLTSHPAFAEELKCLRILKAEAGGKYPICAYATGAMTMPTLLMGMESWMGLLLTGPAEVRDELLTKCSDFYQKLVAAYRAAGADVILYANPFGSTALLPPKLMRSLSVPWMKRDLAPGGAAGLVYYCGSAPINDMLETAIAELGFGVYFPSPLEDLAEAKRIVAGRGLTCGVLNDIQLLDWSKEEIRAEVTRIIEAGKPGGKFLFATHVMPYAIPEPSIRAMLDAAYEVGQW